MEAIEPTNGEQLEPNLDEVLDFRFAGIEAELFVVLQHLEAVERQLRLVGEKELERLEREELSGVNDEYVYHEIRRWIDEFVEDVLPRLFRSPILIELWAVFESGIIEIAKYLQRERGHSISIEDLRANNDFESAQKYYDKVLRFPLISIDSVKERLNILGLVRNAVAHSNGRIEVIRRSRLSLILEWERKHGGVSTDGDYLNFTAEFVASMAEAVKTSLEDLITRVKEKH